LASALRAQNNPVPFVNQPLIPDTIRPGGPGFKLTVTGTGFAPGAVVNWNGSPRVTTVVSSSKLVALINATDVPGFETAAVTVANPAPGGGTSNVIYFPITKPAPMVAFARSDDPCCADAPGGLVAGDFREDGNLDLVAWSQGTEILFGLGGGRFLPPQ